MWVLICIFYILANDLVDELAREGASNNFYGSKPALNISKGQIKGKLL